MGAKYYTQEQAVAAVERAHGDRYDLSRLVYKSSKDKVEVGCKIHGWFTIRFNGLTQEKSRGCQKCGVAACTDPHRDTLDDFIIKAHKKHDSKYIYLDSEYKNNKSTIRVVCPVHGEFSQIANDHLNGCGCPSCANSSFKKDKPAHVYVLKITSPVGSFVGYGISGNIHKRLREHKKNLLACGFTIENKNLFLVSGDTAHFIEKILLNKFQKQKEHRIKGFLSESTYSAMYEEVLKTVKEYINE